MESHENTSMEVVLISGLIASGKSELLKGLLRLPRYTADPVIQKDAVTKRYWGDRLVDTKTGLLFGNELTRNEIKTHLILERPKRVFVEMPMLTQKRHQKPFLWMLDGAKRYIEGVEKERADRNGDMPPAVEIALKAILLYADSSTSIQRMREKKNPNEIFDENLYRHNASQFELPDQETYPALFLDTSEDILGASENGADYFEENFLEAKAFLEGAPLDEGKMILRRSAANRYLEEARKGA